MFSLQGKTALITGAASGIGASLARTYAGAGARILVADLDARGAEALAAELTAGGAWARPEPLDVASETACAALADRLRRDRLEPDILVNNAGIGTVGTILETSHRDFDRLFQVNVRGVFNLTKEMLPGMVERRRGVIINMSSVGGVVGIRERLAYCATKSAVIGMTKCLALDHASAGIRANCICPGRVETPFVQARLKEYPDPAKAYQEMASTQLFGRMIRPEEIAAAALYLASDEAAMVTGTSLLIECGWTAGKS